MNTKKLLALVGITSAILAGHAFGDESVRPPAGLEEGVETTLSEAQLKALEPWMETSKTKIADLLESVKVMPARSARDSLVSGIQKIISTSAPKATETLLRYTLNRALKIEDMVERYATGDKEAPRVLDLEIWMLKRALELSQRYYESDIAYLHGAGKVAPLYSRYGIEYSYLLMNSDQSVLIAAAQYRIAIFALQLLAWDLYRDPNKAQYAPVIMKIANFLKMYPVDPPARDDKALDLLRKARLTYQKSTETLKGIVGADAYLKILENIDCMLVEPDAIPDYSKFRPLETVAVSPYGVSTTSKRGGKLSVTSTNNRTTVRAAESGALQVYDRDGTYRYTMSESAYGIAISPNGKHLAAVRMSGSIAIWDLGSNEAEALLKDSSVAALYSPNGKYLLTISNDHTAHLWDPEDEKLITKFEGHTDVVSSAIFSADGRLVLTSSWDGTVRIWNFESRRLLAVLASPIHEPVVGGVTGVAISEDGKRISMSLANHTSVIWGMYSCKK